MVSRARLKALLTGVALYAMAAATVGYFSVNAYTGKYGLNARQELDQEIISLTSELARLKKERIEGEKRVSLLTGWTRTCSTSGSAISSNTPTRAIWSSKSTGRTENVGQPCGRPVICGHARPSAVMKFQNRRDRILKMSFRCAAT